MEESIDFFVPIIRVNEALKLKAFTSQATNFQAANFVVDAFADLSAEFKRCAMGGRIYGDDPFLSNLVVYKGSESADDLYNRHLTNYSNAMAAQFEENNAKVKDFDEFIQEFQRLLGPALPQFPFTQPGFIKSRLCPISCSGLAIEIANLDYSNDEEKINQFVNSGNWEFYINACRSYGFMVDKFVPWRLVADIGSSEMISYAATYCGANLNSTNQLLNVGYTTAHTSFFNNFKYILYNLYNKVKLKSFLEPIDCNGVTVFTKTTPRTYSLEEFSNLYSESYFLKLYFELRLLEEESVLEDFEHETLIDDSIELYFGRGLNAALDAFERVANKTFDYRGSLSYTKEYLDTIAAEET